MGEYRAPGVYVEEIPSAQQPIAGVGTNTVGFIGQVKKTIYSPEPNRHYDPVIAQAALRLTQLRADVSAAPDEIKRDEIQEGIATETRRLTLEFNALKSDHDAREARRPTLEAERSAKSQAFEGAQKARNDFRFTRDPNLDDEQNQAKERDEIRRLDAAIHSTSMDLEKVNADLADLTAEIGRLSGDMERIDNLIRATQQGTQSNPEPDESALLSQSMLQPYVLKPFEIQVEPYDTKLCTNFTEYTNRFGYFSADNPYFVPTPEQRAKGILTQALCPEHRALTHAVNGFFKNGGTRCFVALVDDAEPDIERVLEAFESIDELAIIAAPGLKEEDLKNTWDNLITFCEGRENCFAILDSPADLGDEKGFLDVEKLSYANPDSLLPSRNRNAAFYVPHIEVVDPAVQLQDEDPARKVDPRYKGRVYVPPSGHIAGIYARTDEQRGVHKAPANTPILGALNVAYYISKPKQELLNPQGVNCIRTMNGNITVWGARTVGGDKNGEWKYINVRRLFLFLRKSIDEGTQWVVFEPNDPALWGKIRRNLTAFLTNVWRSGALFGLTPEEAFYVKCDAETNPPEVRDLGQVVTEVGVAIVRPAEFVIFRVTQATGPRTS